MSQSNIYCNNPFNPSRFITREVMIGDLALGADNPIRVQSMTTADTMNAKATVEESIRMIEAGSELVRITAPSMKEAENLRVIKAELHKRGYKTPLVADIHFTPKAAELAAEIVEKVRINPGNYADKKKFQHIEYTDQTYNDELDRIREKFLPLVKLCKQNGTAMRIGTNHGSLSDRILSRFGDTPLGMVESAMEFLRICADENYHDIVLSMKASNTKVMVAAYRLLVKTMIDHDMNYPLHLGVTEAGEAEDGRIKSAVGIGALLADGIGDTVRVSLTEKPEAEIPVAQKIIAPFNALRTGRVDSKSFEGYQINPFEYTRRETQPVLNIGGNQVPVVIADYSLKEQITPASLFAVGYLYNKQTDKFTIADMAADYVFVGEQKIDFELPGTLGVIQNHKQWLTQKDKMGHYPMLSPQEFLGTTEKSPKFNLVYACLEDFDDAFIQALNQDSTAVLLIDTYAKENQIQEQRKIFNLLLEKNCQVPVLGGRAYAFEKEEDLMVQASIDLGSLLIDGFCDGIFIADEGKTPKDRVNSIAFGILQATRSRISKTEYISCPSCGRTLFDLTETTAKIRAVTDHLKGVKIGIMGCIVNGPGEMADADYGYVGTGPGKITLYKEKQVVERNIAEEKAVDALIDLIKAGGDWIEK